MKKTKVWVAGAIEPDYGMVVRGIYTSQDKAVARCVEPNHFVAPCFLDEDLGGEKKVDWPGVYFPCVESLSQSVESVLDKKFGYSELVVGSIQYEEQDEEEGEA